MARWPEGRDLIHCPPVPILSGGGYSLLGKCLSLVQSKDQLFALVRVHITFLLSLWCWYPRHRRLLIYLSPLPSPALSVTYLLFPKSSAGTWLCLHVPVGHVCGSQRPSSVYPSSNIHLVFETGSLTSHSLYSWPVSPRIHQSPPPLTFSCAFWGSNSGPCAYKVSILLTALTPLPTLAFQRTETN